MPTVITTGKDLTLTVNSLALSPQCSNVELTYENQIETYKTLTGTVKKVVGTDGNLTMNLFQDFSAASSFCESLWSAAETGTAITFSLLVGGASGTVFTGSVIPQFPKVGGAADAALEASITFPITGTVTLDTTP